MELDVLGAESEGQIGYLLESEISGQLDGAQVVALLTQTVVDPKDPAFQNPTKFIGPMYFKEDAERCALDRV
jgi:carbamate kinase